MRAEDIITSLDKVRPFFQPVFSADEHRAAGYEVLGRIETESGYESIGPFLLDSEVPVELRMEVDNYLTDQALSLAAVAEGDFFIFINRDPYLLMEDHGEELLNIIQKRLPPQDYHRVVIDLTGTDCEDIIDSLQHVLSYYRTFGIKVAIGRIGSDSRLDRIAQLSPHILRVNLDHLLKRNPDVSQVMLFSLSMLARKIGASLLFEHIESDYQLRYAWKNGGRYYQGFLLSKPEPGLADRDILREKFKKECRSYIGLEMKKLESVYQKTSDFNENIKTFLSKNKASGYGIWLHQLAKKIEPMCFRLYICNEEGFQTSPNLLKQNGTWVVQDTYRDKNWSWRPYFLENIIHMKHEKKGILSDLYSDIETGDTIRTFSYPLDHAQYLFIDLSYEYLYENDEFL